MRNLVRTFHLLLVATVVGTLAICFPGAASAAPAPAPVTGAPQWTRTHLGPQQYPNMAGSQVSVTMSDGAVLYGTLYRPADAGGRPIDEKQPVVVNLTPYTKLLSAVAQAAIDFPPLGQFAVDLFNAINLRGVGLGGYNDLVGALKSGLIQTTFIDSQLVKSGYAQLVLDVRGTGTSQGTWQVFGQRERDDTVEVIDWAAKQNWSNGKVAMAGTSYSAINQLAAGAQRPPALKALFPVVPGGDLVYDVIVPGGGAGGFVAPWLAAVNLQKMLPNLELMLRGQFDFKWLADRIKDPVTYMPLIFEALLTPSIDKLKPETRALVEDGSERRRTLETAVEKITVPTFTVGAWNDLFTNTQWRMLSRLKLPDAQKKLVMTDGYHVTSASNLGKPGAPPRTDVLQRAWFDKWLKGIDNGIDRYRQATVQSQPGGAWRTADTYPTPGQTYQKTYLTGTPSWSHNTPTLFDGSLSPKPPTAPASPAVAPGLSTLCSRDAGQFSTGLLALLDACGRDSRVSELGALSFTTPRFTKTTTISGPLSVRLNQRLEGEDGYWSATVNAVAPDGTSTVISSGQLMVSLRAVDEERSTRAANGALADTRLVMRLNKYERVRPRQTLAIDIPMSATQAELPVGYRIRLDLYAFNFPKGVPLGPSMFDSMFRPQTAVIDPRQPSWVNIPMSVRD